MQDYISIAEKNGIELLNSGRCQFCGANTTRGVHECVEIFCLGFNLIDYGVQENHYYRFLSVDAHTLQHPEIHGRWNNHFHLLRLHLIFKYKVRWNYQLSPQLSDHLNRYKAKRVNEFLTAPEVLRRGNLNTVEILENAHNEHDCKDLIEQWAKAVYASWDMHHDRIDGIAKTFV